MPQELSHQPAAVSGTAFQSTREQDGVRVCVYEGQCECFLLCFSKAIFCFVRKVAVATQELKESVAKAAKQIKEDQDATPTTFLLDLPNLVPQMSRGQVEPFNTDQPRIIENCLAIKELQSNPKAQLSIGNFGSSYKKTESFKEHGWYQCPVGPGKGAEECEVMFGAFGPDKDGTCGIPGLAHKTTTLGTISGVLSTFWFYGIDPCKCFAGPTRNGLPQLKIQCAGTVMQLVFCTHRCIKLWAADAPKDLDAVVEKLKWLTHETLKALIIIF